MSVCLSIYLSSNQTKPILHDIITKPAFFTTIKKPVKRPAYRNLETGLKNLVLT